MKGHMESDGFHPHTTYKGVRKSRDQQAKTQGVRLKRNQVKNKYGTFTWSPKSLRVNQVVKIKDLTGRHGKEVGTSRVAITEATNHENFKEVANNPPIINGKVIGVVKKGQILNKKFEVVSV